MLTPYPQGSLRELWRIAYPLMLSSLSVMVMLFVDRFLLAQYSLETFNAAVSAGTMGWAFVWGAMSLAAISEVFVAQFNGAGEKDKLGKPVWQMIWVSCLTVVLFIPLAIWGPNLFFPDSALHRQYFELMMVFGPSYPIYSALAGYFVGQGRVALITWLSLIANCINVILDVILIFGIEGWVPSLGIRGAIIATCSSQIIQAAVLYYVFSQRPRFAKPDWYFDSELTWRCLKIGLPGAFFALIEIFGWAIYYKLMEWTSFTHITIAGVCQSFIILLFFFGEGLSKAVTAVSANLIGAEKKELVRSTLLAGVRLMLLFFITVQIGFFFFSDEIAEFFMRQQESRVTDTFMMSLHSGFLISTFYLLFEGIRYVIGGVLTGAGDTMFLFASGCINIWLLLIIPIYFLVVLGGGSVELSLMLMTNYGLLSMLIYYVRFRQGRWKELTV